MTRPRSQIVSLDDTPYYHCISRCVRRAFLCGTDSYTNKSFDHRKPWLTDRIKQLSSIFAIDIAAYAIMSNHYHLVLHVDINRAAAWSESEVINRWLSLYKGPDLIHQYRDGDVECPIQLGLVEKLVAIWRKRLSDISWYMRCLNEYIARKANQEDNCTGRFWEGRFKSQALLDEAALLSCMAYVDLNPVRAGIARNLTESDYTSIQLRIHCLAQTPKKQSQPKELLPFSGMIKDDNKTPAIPFKLHDYLELTDWTGRSLRNDKKGFISTQEPKLLRKLGIDESQWSYLALNIQKRTITTLHGMESLKKRAVTSKRVA